MSHGPDEHERSTSRIMSPAESVPETITAAGLAVVMCPEWCNEHQEVGDGGPGNWSHCRVLLSFGDRLELRLEMYGVFEDEVGDGRVDAVWYYLDDRGHWGSGFELEATPELLDALSGIDCRGLLNG